jgi:hypothetical protein
MLITLATPRDAEAEIELNVDGEAAASDESVIRNPSAAT